jgi:hypothetical protein
MDYKLVSEPLILSLITTVVTILMLRLDVLHIISNSLHQKCSKPGTATTEILKN